MLMILHGFHLKSYAEGTVSLESHSAKLLVS